MDMSKELYDGIRKDAVEARKIGEQIMAPTGARETWTRNPDGTIEKHAWPEHEQAEEFRDLDSFVTRLSARAATKGKATVFVNPDTLDATVLLGTRRDGPRLVLHVAAAKRLCALGRLAGDGERFGPAEAGAFVRRQLCDDGELDDVALKLSAVSFVKTDRVDVNSGRGHDTMGRRVSAEVDAPQIPSAFTVPEFQAFITPGFSSLRFAATAVLCEGLPTEQQVMLWTAGDEYSVNWLELGIAVSKTIQSRAGAELCEVVVGEVATAAPLTTLQLEPEDTFRKHATRR